jgi:hypothetical protein
LLRSAKKEVLGERSLSGIPRIPIPSFVQLEEKELISQGTLSKIDLFSLDMSDPPCTPAYTNV